MISTDRLALAIGLSTGLATLVGGGAALRFKRRLDLLLGFGGGAILGVALLDLLPEALRLAGADGAEGVVLALAGGFALNLVLDRLTQGATGAGSKGARRRVATLVAHSFMDGLGIGLAFQVSVGVGAVVALAVLAHDMLDGANTVTLSLAGGGRVWTARLWLAADAVAPLLGILASRVVMVPQPALALLLAVFAGFFLYIGAGELVPQAHLRRPRLSTTGAVLCGMGLILAAVRLAGG